MSNIATMPDSRILLEGVQFETYARLVTEAENPGLRFNFDGGRLEIMSPSARHESWKRMLGRMIEAMTEELEIEIKSGGSTTFKSEVLQKGTEPDECYWVQHEPVMRDKLDWDPDTDPAPDLAVESAASRSVLDRLGILAALGVGEVWRYDGEHLTVLVRNAAGGFEESSSSRCFPWLPVVAFANQCRPVGEAETTWIRRFRQWVRATIRVADDGPSAG